MTNAIQEEQQHLDAVVSEIGLQRRLLKENISKLEEEYAQGMKDASEIAREEDRLDMIRRLNYDLAESNFMSKGHFLARLDNQVDNPYFARIDFKAKNSDTTQKVYIGKFAYVSNNQKHLISDWRSPIASVYYNYPEPTKDAYFEYEIEREDEKRKVFGEMSLRRNIEIAKSKILAIYDNNLRIDLLSSTLAENAGGVLKDIVRTIQGEQNEIIRSNPERVCVVQGTAGSGKTTIAIHRISYLFYTFSKLIHENNTLLLSSSQVLVNYVVKTLPELEIKSLERNTLPEFLKRVLARSYFEIALFGDIKHKGEHSAEKNTKEFLDNLDKFAAKRNAEILEELKALENEDLNFDNFINRFKGERTYECIKEIIEDYEEDLPFLQQELKKQKRNTPLEMEIEAKKSMLKPLKKMVKELDILKEYQSFLLEYKYPFMAEKYELDIDDVCACYYLSHKICGVRPDKQFKQIIVDEGQDLGFLNYTIVNMLSTNNGFTILGDLNQATEQEGSISDWSDLEQIWDKKDIDTYEIKVSYRTTKEITALARSVLSKFKEFKHLPEPFDRSGDAPVIEQKENREEILKTIARDIKELRKDNARSVGIIETDNAKVQETSEALKKLGLEHLVIDDEFEDFNSSSVYLVPEELVKGLEFDSVFVIDPNDKIFDKSTTSAKRLFVCCTRAINNLYIYYTDKINPLLNN